MPYAIKATKSVSVPKHSAGHVFGAVEATDANSILVDLELLWAFTARARSKHFGPASLNNNLMAMAPEDEWVIGTAGDDTLNGGAGADTMVGGTGNDTYYVDNAGDVVGENANQGRDEVRASVDYTLGANVEGLVLEGSAIMGAGNDLDNRISGNGNDNVLNGAAGNDTLNGGAGVDTITGGLGEDVLDGGEASDQMAGGEGNDTYYVTAWDSITENAGEGIDTVILSVGFTQLWFLSDNVENLVLTGNTNHGIGNSLNNHIIGHAGQNYLNGGGGLDTLEGGGGPDVYFVTNPETVIIEVGDGASNEVIATVDFQLPSHVEWLLLSQNAIYGAGNELNNRIEGNSIGNQLSGEAGNDMLLGGDGADTLDGGTGADTLTGGAGADWFGLNRWAAGTDALVDYTTGSDRIVLNSFGLAPLRIDFNFIVNAGPSGARATLLYNSITGVLSFDADGTGSAAAAQIAVISSKPSLTASDFLLI